MTAAYKLQHNSRYRTVALLLLCLGQLMVVLDISIINIAIPTVQREMGLTPSVLHWLVTGYVLTYGGFILVGGRLGDLFGRRRVLLIGLATFTVASAIGGLSTGAASLLAARAGQGLGGAIITPTVLAFVAGLYPEGARRNRALSVFGAVSGAGFALGLILGGLLTSTVGWRWVFFINLPIGIFAIIMALWLLPETPRQDEPIALPGAALATFAMAAATFTMSNAGRIPLLSWPMVTMTAVTAASFYALIAVERRAPYPLIPPGLLHNRSLIRGLIGASVFGIVVNPSTFILTLYLQNIGEMDPFTTGIAFLPQEAVVFLAAALAGRYVTRFSTRNVMVAGMLAFGGASLWLTRLSAAGTYADAVLPGLLLMGAGIGVINVAGSIAATEGTPIHQHGAAAGIWNAGMQIGTAMGLAMFTAIADARTAALLGLSPSMNAVEATVSGYQTVFYVAAAVSGAGLGLLFGKLGKRPEGDRAGGAGEFLSEQASPPG